MSKNKHIVPNKDGGWSVKSGGQEISRQNTQKAAIEIATSIARNDRSEVVIHGRDGKIRDKNSYGKDPFPPKG